MSRLPKQFWRVIVLDNDKIRVYDRGSKTYASASHAQKAIEDFANRGIRAEMYTTGPVEWKSVSVVHPADLDMEPLF